MGSSVDMVENEAWKRHVWLKVIIVAADGLSLLRKNIIIMRKNMLRVDSVSKDSF